MWNEVGWIGERQRLCELRRNHPEWGIRAYAQETGQDPKWVRKWLKRFEGHDEIMVDVLSSQSRRPRHSPHQLAARVKERIVELRETLSEQSIHLVTDKRATMHLPYLDRPDQAMFCSTIPATAVPTISGATSLPLYVPTPFKQTRSAFGCLIYPKLTLF